jgi:hypothetical protein
MELIPILSTIILVATICTFILAIGAYILYKIRERKGEQVPFPKPSTVRAELVTPEETEYGKEEYEKQQAVKTPVEHRHMKGIPKPGEYPLGKEFREAQLKSVEQELPKNERVKTGKKFLKYTTEGYVPTEEDKNTGELKWR